MDDQGPPGWLFPTLIGVIGTIALVVLATFVVVIIHGARRWHRNNAAPLVTLPATLVGKRAHVSGGSGESSASTTYFLTFESEGEERIELPVRGADYGRLVEGDRGRLTHQGMRFKGFERER
ncbi:uncharacterized protein DUF2500 [Motilibacter rhizosphaerae]|uniref:Uncharacterized protein DUF2500 n=1 Tax=Motilibacter rhizosphaerae TaxID=598652 RepID=A0A4Q7NWA2_9ACTN|nr:DUF2500 domain-containing protein [Motilibacter rhizosphaerae]RZS91576.1 uncharacterized protein DUF2500 [Motilibacter rhizosphaerae]